MSADVNFSGDDLGRIQAEVLEVARPQGEVRLRWDADTGDLLLVYVGTAYGHAVPVRQGCYDTKTGRRLDTSAMVALAWIKMHDEFKRRGWLK